MENTETPLQVIKTDGTDIINCSNCKRNLMRIIKRPGKDTLFKITVVCPFCKDKSFHYEIKQDMKYIPADGVELISCEHLPGNIVKFYTKVRN